MIRQAHKLIERQHRERVSPPRTEIARFVRRPRCDQPKLSLRDLSLRAAVTRVPLGPSLERPTAASSSSGTALAPGRPYLLTCERQVRGARRECALRPAIAMVLVQAAAGRLGVIFLKGLQRFQIKSPSGGRSTCSPVRPPARAPYTLALAGTPRGQHNSNRARGTDAIRTPLTAQSRAMGTRAALGRGGAS
jgi:hypothetical protein